MANIIKNKSFEFSLNIIKLYKILISCNEFILSKQLLRSATSIGANIAEATNSESKNDFIHKMSIALKESQETIYWLELLQKSQIVKQDYEIYILQIKEIIKILTKIVKTTKINLNS